jgi:hypothetical protein
MCRHQQRFVCDIFVMCGKKLINIWLAFRNLGLQMNFDNFIGVTWTSNMEADHLCGFDYLVYINLENTN